MKRIYHFKNVHRMNMTSAIAKALIEGKKISIRNGFYLFGCTNIPREMSRLISQRFGVEVRKTLKKFKSRYGEHGYYFEYDLVKEGQKDAVNKMIEYIKKHE